MLACGGLWFEVRDDPRKEQIGAFLAGVAGREGRLGTNDVRPHQQVCTHKRHHHTAQTVQTQTVHWCVVTLQGSLDIPADSQRHVQ